MAKVKALLPFTHLKRIVGSAPWRVNVSHHKAISALAFGTHLQTSGGTAAGTFITETNVPEGALSTGEAGFLTQACQFAIYLGSNKGTCTCK